MSVELEPTPQMRAAARLGLARAVSERRSMSRRVSDRAKRIARGVRLDQADVRALDREHRSLDLDEVEKLVRGGASAIPWALEKQAELAAASVPAPTTRILATAGDELRGASLADARQARRLALRDEELEGSGSDEYYELYCADKLHRCPECGRVSRSTTRCPYCGSAMDSGGGDFGGSAPESDPGGSSATMSDDGVEIDASDEEPEGQWGPEDEPEEEHVE